MSDERRNAPRAGVPAGAVAKFRAADGADCEHRLTDLSATGLFMETTQSMSLGESLNLSLNIPGYDVLEVEGRVARVTASGVAVDFSRDSCTALASNDKLTALLYSE